MYGSIHVFFIQIFISFSIYSSYSRYSLFHLCGNKCDHQTQAGSNADGDAEIGSLSKPSDNRWSYQETEETDARNDGDGNARLDFGDAITDPRIKASKVKYWGFLQDWLGHPLCLWCKRLTVERHTPTGRVYGMWLMTHPLVITRLLLYNSLYLATMHFRLFIIVDAYKNHVTNIVHQRFPISLTLDLTDSSIGIIIPLQL